MEETVSAYFVQVLKKDLELRKKYNRQYSMRAHARYFGMGPSTLSRVLNGEQDLTPTMYCTIMKRLQLTNEQRIAFIASVASQKMHRAFRGLLSARDEAESEEQDVFDESPEVFNPLCMEDLFANSKDVFLILSQEGKILYANPSASRVVQLVELIGSPVPEELRAVLGQVLASKTEHRMGERTFRPILDRASQLRAVLLQMELSDFSHNFRSGSSY